MDHPAIWPTIFGPTMQVVGQLCFHFHLGLPALKKILDGLFRNSSNATPRPSSTMHRLGSQQRSKFIHLHQDQCFCISNKFLSHFLLIFELTSFYLFNIIFLPTSLPLTNNLPRVWYFVSLDFSPKSRSDSLLFALQQLRLVWVTID